MTSGLETETLRAFPDYDSDRTYRPSSSSDIFPRPRELEPQVKFWRKAYAAWSQSQVAIHDKRYMDVVYEVFQLPGYVGDNLTAEQKDFIQERMSYWRNRLNNLEDRLSAGVRLGPDEQHLMNEIAQTAGGRTAIYGAGERLRYQRGLRERFKRGLTIGSRYDRRFRQIFRSAGLPEDLAYLPHVESSFQANAHSSAGALGIWQFTAGAARVFMNGDDSVAARLDPIASTYGAARYLSSAYNKLGSWPLAVTSYNHGIGGMQRAKNRFGLDFPSIVKHYDSPQFGFASRNYYAEFLAARDIASDPGRFFPEGTGDEGGAVWANASTLVEAFAPESAGTPISLASVEGMAKEEPLAKTTSMPAPLEATASPPIDPPATPKSKPPGVISVSQTAAPDDTQMPLQAANEVPSEAEGVVQEESTPITDFPAFQPPQQSEAPSALQDSSAVPTVPEEVTEEDPGQFRQAPAVPAPRSRDPQPPSKVAPAPRPEPAKAVQTVSKAAVKPPAKANSVQADSSAPKKVASNPAPKSVQSPTKPSKSVPAAKEKPVKGVFSPAPRTVPPKTASHPSEPKPKPATKNPPPALAVASRTGHPTAVTPSKAQGVDVKKEKTMPKSPAKNKH